MHSICISYVCNPVYVKECVNMNVYDFDGTIYNGDSTIDLFIYSLIKKPYIAYYIPKIAFGFILYMLGKIDKKRLKELFFCFLPSVFSEKFINDFWKHNRNKVYDWYLNVKKDDDIIISASPEFLLKPICHQLGVNKLIASKVDVKTGKFTSENCLGEEKVRRIQMEVNILNVDEFYSDSYSDFPLAQIARAAFIVKKGKIYEWDF